MELPNIVIYVANVEKQTLKGIALNFVHFGDIVYRCIAKLSCF